VRLRPTCSPLNPPRRVRISNRLGSSHPPIDGKGNCSDENTGRESNQHNLVALDAGPRGDRCFINLPTVEIPDHYVSPQGGWSVIFQDVSVRSAHRRRSDIRLTPVYWAAFDDILLQPVALRAFENPKVESRIAGFDESQCHR
jgi:hypothetical protein